MQKPHELIITVSPSGETKIEVQGIKGRSCKDVTRELEAALGETVRSTPTKEMYAREDETVRIRR
jgi:hypothetical protein